MVAFSCPDLGSKITPPPFLVVFRDTHMHTHTHVTLAAGIRDNIRSTTLRRCFEAL